MKNWQLNFTDPHFKGTPHFKGYIPVTFLTFLTLLTLLTLLTFQHTILEKLSIIFILLILFTQVPYCMLKHKLLVHLWRRAGDESLTMVFNNWDVLAGLRMKECQVMYLLSFFKEICYGYTAVKMQVDF